jgi:outer membrane protein with beta-barrel domain
MRFSSLILAAAVAAPVVARAQNAPDTLSLLGRSTISLGFGLTGARTASEGVGQTSTHSTGQVGAIAFTHWVRPTVAVEISAAALNADATTSGAHSHANVVTPVLFGLSVSPRSLALSTSLRPYLSAAVGPYVHSIADDYGATSTASVETVLGSRLAAGANWFVSRHFVMGLETNYHAVGKFEHPDAVTDRTNGFGMSLAFGFAWGGR